MASGFGVSEGMTCSKEWVVGEEHVAAHLAARGIKVLSTPCMILFIEATLRECLDEVLPGGYTTVGIRVDARHRAPVPVGGRVRVEARVLLVDGRRVLSYAKVTSEGRLVGDAVHERYIVEEGEYLERLKGR